MTVFVHHSERHGGAHERAVVYLKALATLVLVTAAFAGIAALAAYGVSQVLVSVMN